LEAVNTCSTESSSKDDTQPTIEVFAVRGFEVGFVLFLLHLFLLGMKTTAIGGAQAEAQDKATGLAIRRPLHANNFSHLGLSFQWGLV